MITTKVGLKGQVVIPKELRDEFNILPGERVLFEDAEKGILIRKQKEDSSVIFRRIALTSPKTVIKNWHFAEQEIEEKLKRILK